MVILVIGFIMNKCNCNICKHSRLYEKHIENIQEVEAKNFFKELFSSYWNISEENEINKYIIDKLKTKDYELYKTLF